MASFRNATGLHSDDAVAIASLEASRGGLRYVSVGESGIRRQRRGAGFVYIDTNGRRIKDIDTLDRIRGLAVPPAYRDVWICRHPRGHLQATGIDARGRKQYRYHIDWRRLRDGSKFDRMVEFGAALPRLRRRLRRDLALPGLPREKVLAVLAALLDRTQLRIGNAAYMRDNQSFGLTTLRARHLQFVRDGRARLHFRGKGGIEREVIVNDRRLTGLMRKCQQLPGQALFQYLDDTGERRGVDSGQVNDYLREVMGGDFTAKDFRTWGATLRAIALMCGTPRPECDSEAAHKACVTTVIRQVAEELGNTPAVCRKAYINPAVFEAWRNGSLHRLGGDNLGQAPRKAEALALRFLRAQRRPTGQSRRQSGRAAAQ